MSVARASLPEAVVRENRKSMLVGWAAVLVGGPLACLIANQAVVYLVSTFPDLQYAGQMVLNVGVNCILAVSLNLINGYTGQFSLGHAGFMAIGAYTAAAVMYYLMPELIGSEPGAAKWGLFFCGALLIAGFAAAVSGLVVGVPSLRLKGDYLAIVTLGFGEIIRVVLLNLESMRGARGFSDLAKVDQPFIVFLGILAVVVVTRNMVASTRGLAFLAVRDDEIAAEAVGVNTTRYKVIAFVVGAFFAGIAGGLYAHTNAYINPGMFDFVKSMEIVAMVVLGGLGSIRGAILAAIGLTLLPEILRGGLLPGFITQAVPEQVWRFLPRWRMAIYSVILIAAMLIQAKRGGNRRPVG